jgi:hypothetical protein
VKRVKAALTSIGSHENLLHRIEGIEYHECVFALETSERLIWLLSGLNGLWRLKWHLNGLFQRLDTLA